jgi:hypothetical protein
MRPFICLFLYHVYDFNLVSLAYIVPSSCRSPSSGGPSVTGAAQVTDPRTPSKPQDSDDGGAVEPKVILLHPTLRAPRDVSLDEALDTARWPLTQAQNVLHRESDGIVDERRRLLLWASMLKEQTTVERARAEARQQHPDMR